MTLKEKEELKLKQLKQYDEKFEGKIIGIDEVGRGPLAGPVVVCGIIMEKSSQILGVKDSKKISEKKREKLYDTILNEAEKVSIVEVDPKRIDEINILEATKEAMNKVIEELEEYADNVLIDAVQGLRANKAKIHPIIKGDDTSYSISCASIIAKVYRDKKMIEYADIYPGYGFDAHKGYGTKKHYDALRELGITDIHRKSFLKTLNKHI